MENAVLISCGHEEQFFFLQPMSMFLCSRTTNSFMLRRKAGSSGLFHVGCCGTGIAACMRACERASRQTSENELAIPAWRQRAA